MASKRLCSSSSRLTSLNSSDPTGVPNTLTPCSLQTSPCEHDTFHSDSNIASSPCATVCLPPTTTCSPPDCTNSASVRGSTRCTRRPNANSSSPFNIYCFASFSALWMARRGHERGSPRACWWKYLKDCGVDCHKRQERTEPWHLHAIIALQNTWSYAPTPLVERSVASGFLSVMNSHCVPHAIDFGPEWTARTGMEHTLRPKSWQRACDTWCLWRCLSHHRPSSGWTSMSPE